MLELAQNLGPAVIEAIASSEMLLPESVSLLVVGGAVGLACAVLSLANDLAGGSFDAR
jgi:hypothetical protein